MMRLGLVVAAIVASIAACGSSDKNTSAAASEHPATTTPPAAAAGGVIEVTGGFATPESVLHDADADVYLVSNINGAPGAADGNGFISRVSPDGAISQQKWIDGASDGVTLDAPKGMALLGDHLYVADVTAVRVFDRTTGAPVRDIPIEGAAFVNDLVAGDGVVYASDTGSDAVYAIDAQGGVTTVIRSEQLGGPNGLAITADGLWVVTFGTGELFLAADGAKTRAIALPKGGLDGVVALPDGTLMISSWEASAIFAGPPAGPFAEAIRDVEAPADIGYDAGRNRLLIPLFKKNVVRIQPLN